MKLGQVYLYDGKPPSNIMQTPSIIFKNSKSTEHTALENGSAEAPFISYGHIITGVILHLTCLVAQIVKNPPGMRETQVQSLGQEDPLEEGMATHSSMLAWRIPWTEEPAGYSPWSWKEWDTTE